MFGKKKEPKTKELSLREVASNRITSEVEQLAPGQALIYKLPELYWSGFAAFLMVKLNPSYPQAGKKYILYTDGIVDGKPTGKKGFSFQSNKPKDYADWVAERSGERFTEM